MRVATWFGVVLLGATAIATPQAQQNSQNSPVLMVRGCVERDRTTAEQDRFVLTRVKPSGLDQELSITAGAYRLDYMTPDLLRHLDEEVEIVGVIDGADADDAAPQRLAVKSIRMVNEECPRPSTTTSD